MSRPLALTICGQEFSVAWDDLVSKDADGDEAEVRFAEKKITIYAADMAPGHERMTLAHEVLHGIVELTAQEDRFVEKGEEAVVHAMSVALVQVLRDNPNLVAYLVSA